MRDTSEVIAEMQRFADATHEHGSIDAAVVRQWIESLRAAAEPADAGRGHYQSHLDAIRSLVSPLQWDTICEVFREQDEARPPSEAAADARCGCEIELAAMVAHNATDFDYARACQCALYPKEQQCECGFCQRRLASQQAVKP